MHVVYTQPPFVNGPLVNSSWLREVYQLTVNTESNTSDQFTRYGALGHIPLDFQLFTFCGSFQSRTNSDIQLHVVAYPVKQYTGI